MFKKNRKWMILRHALFPLILYHTFVFLKFNKANFCLLLKLPCSFWKKKITYILKNSIYERELESFHFEKKNYIITMEKWKSPSGRKKRKTLKMLWQNHSKRVNVSKIYICVWRLYLFLCDYVFNIHGFRV